MNERSKTTLEDFKETDEQFTDWDTLKGTDSPAKDENIDVEAIMDSAEVPALDFADDTPNSAETSAEYTATNAEIYNSLLNQFNKEIFFAENNGNPPEITQARSDARDILIDVYLTNVIDTTDSAPEIPLATAIERRKAVYDQKAELYSKLGDANRAKEQANLSARTTELLSYTSSIQKNLEDQKNPNSNQLSYQFK